MLQARNGAIVRLIHIGSTGHADTWIYRNEVMGQEFQIPETSPSLLLRIRDASDTTSWQTFEEVYRPIIVAWCLRKRLAPSDADDVAQEVLLSVSRAIKDFDYLPARGKFRAWLGTITANEVNDHLGKKRYLPLEDLVAGNALVPLADPDSDWIAIHAASIFEAACERIRDHFEPTTWECFTATWIRRQPSALVAREMAIPVHSVYVNKSRVLKRLEAEVLLLAEEISPLGTRSDQEPDNGSWKD